MKNILASTQKCKKLLPVENYATKKKFVFHKKIRLFAILIAHLDHKFSQVLSVFF